MPYRINAITGELDLVDLDNVPPTVATTYNADAGSATPAANIINFLGTAAQGISSSAAGNTVTYTIANATDTQKGVASFNLTNFTVTAGAVASNALTVTAGTGLSTGGAVNLGGSVTLNLTVPVIATNGGTGQTTYAQGDILYASAINTLSKLTAAVDGQVLTLAAGVPTWASNPSGDVVGPAGATTTAIAVYDGATGKLIANSIPTIDSSGNILTSASLSGATLSMDVVNSSNTANSVARLSTTVGGTSAGDAVFQASVSGGQTWSWGLDNSDSDAFVLASSVALGTTNVIQASTAGNINYPLQCKFSAYLASTDADETGDGTQYQLGTAALTELFDIGSNFNTNGTFTAPVTGYYHFCYGVLAQQVVSTMSASSSLTVAGTSARIYIDDTFSTTATGNFSTCASRIVFMTATDTAVVKVIYSNGTKVVDIYGGNDTRTYFSGTLIG